MILFSAIWNELKSFCSTIGNGIKSFFGTKNLRDNQTERALRNIAFIIVCGLISIIFYAIGVPGQTGQIGVRDVFKTAVIGLLISGAALALGALFGLLFGIPRSLQDAPVPVSPAASNGESNAVGGNTDKPPSQPALSPSEPAVRSNLSQNTNLEQISDWLTKILVGVSLTQFQAIQTKFRGVAQAVARELNGAQEATGAAIILFFLVCGFLISYLWVRRYLEKEFGDASRENRLIESARKEGKEEGIKEGTTAVKLASRLNAPLTNLAPQSAALPEPPPEPPAEQEEAVRDTLAPAPRPNFVDPPAGPNADDPWQGQFGGSPSANDRILEVVVKPFPGNPYLFSVKLSVRSTDPKNKPLTGVVKFFLHPTFPNDRPVVPVVDGVASFEIVAWGAFTAGAIADDGQTKLELNLAKLPDAPAEFKNR